MGILTGVMVLLTLLSLVILLRPLADGGQPFWGALVLRKDGMHRNRGLDTSPSDSQVGRRSATSGRAVVVPFQAVHAVT